MEERAFQSFVYIWIGMALVLFPVLMRVTIPYGRHTQKGWGMTIPNRLGWIIMELPALLVFSYFFLDSTAETRGAAWVFFFLWVIHYTNRSLFFPLRIRTSGKQMPVVIMTLAVFFNLVNGYLNGHYLGSLHPWYPLSWLYDARFILGGTLFAVGMGINWHSDRVLIRLRNSDKRYYAIPEGGLFRYVSCPNFLGELAEWTGFAIMTWSLPGLAFALWSATNLIPRAMDHHRWYHRTFDNYPADRKAIFPFIL